jgi:hypothetical protein
MESEHTIYAKSLMLRSAHYAAEYIASSFCYFRLADIKIVRQSKRAYSQLHPNIWVKEQSDHL